MQAASPLRREFGILGDAAIDVDHAEAPEALWGDLEDQLVMVVPL